MRAWTPMLLCDGEADGRSDCTVKAISESVARRVPLLERQS
jgi:hypothetical protein